VLCDDGEAACDSHVSRREETGDREGSGCCGEGGDGGLGAGDAGRDRVGRRERLEGRGFERRTEGERPSVAAAEGVTGRQGGLAVAAGEGDRAGVAGGSVAV